MMLKDNFELCIRKMQAEDLDTCAEIEKHAPDGWSYASLQGALIDNVSDCYVGVINGEIVAFCSVQSVLEELTLNGITVAPIYRQNKIAQKLLTYVFDIYEPCNIFLEVRSSNIAAINLYSSLNFEKAGIRKDFYSAPKDDAIVMSRRTKC